MIGCIDKGMLGHTPIHCTVNPTLYKYECEPITEAAEKKRVAIVGAGPAGCEAALTASKRGHQVTLFEKRGFGGAMVEASRPDNKANIRRLIRYYEEHILADPNITLVKENADFDTLANGGFDACLLYTSHHRSPHRPATRTGNGGLMRFVRPSLSKMAGVRYDIMESMRASDLTSESAIMRV